MHKRLLKSTQFKHVIIGQQYPSEVLQKKGVWGRGGLLESEVDR